MADNKSYADAFVKAALAAAQTVAGKNPGHCFYALALWNLTEPRIALNSEEAFAGNHPDAERTFASPRFDPAQFHWPDLALKGVPEAPRSSTQRMRALQDAAKRLAQELPKHISTSKDFIVYLFDEAGLTLVKKTVPKNRFERLFPEADPVYVERRRLEALPPTERVAALLERLGQYEGLGSEEARDWLALMKGDAVTPLVAALDTMEEERWAIASVLGEIGRTLAAEAIPTLRRLADDSGKGGNWCAMVLGFFGDRDFLLERARAGVHVGILGLCSPMRSFADEAVKSSGEHIPMAFDWIETFLETATDEQRKAVEKELAPGSSGRHVVQQADIDAAMKALSSRFAVLRWTAADTLSHVQLGKAPAAQAIAALLPLLEDRNHLVRRMTILSLHHHSRHLKPPHWQAMAALIDDKDAVNRSVAQAATKHLARE